MKIPVLGIMLITVLLEIGRVILLVQVVWWIITAICFLSHWILIWIFLIIVVVWIVINILRTELRTQTENFFVRLNF